MVFRTSCQTILRISGLHFFLSLFWFDILPHKCFIFYLFFCHECNCLSLLLERNKNDLIEWLLNSDRLILRQMVKLFSRAAFEQTRPSVSGRSPATSTLRLISSILTRAVPDHEFTGFRIPDINRIVNSRSGRIPNIGYQIPDSDIWIWLCKKSALLNTLQPRYKAELGVMLLKWKASAKTGEWIYIPDTSYLAGYPVDPDIRYSLNSHTISSPSDSWTFPPHHLLDLHCRTWFLFVQCSAVIFLSLLIRLIFSWLTSGRGHPFTENLFQHSHG